MFKEMPIFVFLIVFFVLVFLIITNVIHCKTDVSSTVVSEKVLFGLPANTNSVTIDGKYLLSDLTNSLENTSLTLSAFEIDESLTTVKELQGIKGKVKLEFSPLKGVYYRVKIFDNKALWVKIELAKDQGKKAAIGLTWQKLPGGHKKRDEVRLDLQAHQLKDVLVKGAVFAPVCEISFRAEKIQIFFHDARLKCGNFEKDFKEEVAVGGRIKDLVSDITFSRTELSDEGILYFTLPIIREGKDSLSENQVRKFVSDIDIKPTEIRNPRFFNFKQGYIKLHKNKYIDLKEEKEQRLISVKGEVKGEKNFRKLLVHDLGIETWFSTKSNDVEVNGKQKQISYLEYILNNLLVTSLLAFVGWLIPIVISLWISKKVAKKEAKNALKKMERLVSEVKQEEISKPDQEDEGGKFEI